MTPRRRLRLFALVVGIVFSTDGLVRAATEQRTIPLNLKRVEITQLIQQIGEATNRTILYDDQVRGTISIVAKRPVDLDEAWAILDASLSILGFSILPSTEGNLRIARIAEAVGEAPFTLVAEGTRDSFVTTLIPLRLASPQVVHDALKPLAGARVTLVPYERTNSLIASGPERAIARLTVIADDLDRVEEREIRHRVMRYREVGEVEGWIESLLENGTLSARSLEIWSDARTNSFIYRGTEDETARFLEILDRIDRPLEASGKVRIYKVLNRDAEEVAEILRSLSQSGSSAGRASGTVSGAEDSTTLLAESDYTIAVDAATRSLVVSAEPGVQDALREVLELIDRPPQLIAVDVKVAQVITPSAFSLGFAFSVPLSPGDELDEVIARMVSIPGGGGLLAQPNAQTPLFGRVSRDAGLPFTIGGEQGLEIPIEDTAVIDAGDFQARTEILIEPNLVVAAGEPQEIFVGDNIPVPVASNTGVLESNASGAGVNLSQTSTIERYDVGVKLGIEARAGEVGKIQLDIDLELSRLAPSAAGDVSAVGPTVAQQTVFASARLDDGDVATIALNKDNQTVIGQSGTPFLSDIPFFGWLFKRVIEREEDSRLVITARARRLGSPAEMVANTIRKRLAFERHSARESKLPEAKEADTPFAVRVTTRRFEEDAQAISEGLERQGHATRIHRWTSGEDELFDVYVVSLESMSDAAELASRLYEDGWETDLIMLPTRS